MFELELMGVDENGDDDESSSSHRAPIQELLLSCPIKAFCVQLLLLDARLHFRKRKQLKFPLDNILEECDGDGG